MSAMAKRLRYLRRVFEAYVLKRESHLTFWHEAPALNENADPAKLGEYYMTFFDKADYPGPRDAAGVPMLDYQGAVGLQYNPIAIAQYGLGNYNLWLREGDPTRRAQVMLAADWLVENLKPNDQGVWVWRHEFDWEYRTPLKAGWYSALSQGQGVSLLLRAHAETGDSAYQLAASRAFDSFLRDVNDGGVTLVDHRGNMWFEETIVDPPTHILNGFMWAAWGVHDILLATGDVRARMRLNEAVRTLRERLHDFDAGYWSLYEHSGTRMKMLASPFYHRLHIVQLRVMARITGDPFFERVAVRWQRFADDPWKRRRALAYKIAFKVSHY